MAIRFVDGVSHYDTQWLFTKWPQNHNAIVNTSIFKSRRASIELDSAYVQRQFSDITENWRVGMSIRFKAGASSFPSQALLIKNSSPQFPATKELWYYQANDISPNPHFEIWGNGSPDGSGPDQAYARLAHWDFTIVGNKWYYLEFFGNPFAPEWYQLAWDGTTVISEVAGPAAGAAGDFIIRITNPASASVPGMYIDNIYLLDKTGFLATPNSFPEVITVHPKSQGVYKEWDELFPAAPGSRDSHVLYVDEILINQSDYLFDRHVGERETYVPTPIVDALPTILGVQSTLVLRPVDNHSLGIGHLVRSNTPSDEVSIAYDSRIGSEELPPDNFINPPGATDFVFALAASIGYWRAYTHVWEKEPEAPQDLWTVATINSTQFGIEILASPSSPTGQVLQFTQHVLEVLIKGSAIPPLPVEDSPSVEVIKSTTHAFSRLFKIQPPDPTIGPFIFTDHNQNLVNPSDGLQYTPVDGFITSAQSRTSGLEPAVMELRGIQTNTSSGMHFNKFHGTVLRNSKVTEYLVDWVYPWAGIFFREVGFLDILTWDKEKWFATVFSQSIPLTWPVGKLYSRVCRHTLGGSGCLFDLTQLEETGIVVQSVPNIARNRSYFLTGGPSGLPTVPDVLGNARDINGYWSFGTLTWTLGSNISLKNEIQSHNSEPSTQDLVLSVPTPFPIEVGDEFNITPGCDKLLGTCNTKFVNLPNFGGYPTVPGYDLAHQPLSSSTRIFGLGDLLDIIL